MTCGRSGVGTYELWILRRLNLWPVDPPVGSPKRNDQSQMYERKLFSFYALDLCFCELQILEGMFVLTKDVNSDWSIEPKIVICALVSVGENAH